MKEQTLAYKICMKIMRAQLEEERLESLSKKENQPRIEATPYPPTEGASRLQKEGDTDVEWG